MKIAYLILAHTDKTNLIRLINALNYKQSTGFFIHIDQKANFSDNEISPLVSRDILEIEIIKKYYVNWAGYSIIKAEYALIKKALASSIDYDRFILLSGLDYPLYSNKKIFEFFRLNKDTEYIKALNLSILFEPPKMLERIEIHHYFRDCNISNVFLKRLITGGSLKIMKLLPFRKKKLFLNSPVYEGSQWWALTKECLVYIQMYCEAHKKELKKYFQHSFAPDELYFHTIVFNSRFKTKSLLHNTNYYPGLVGLTPLHYIEYNKTIEIYVEKDYSKLLSSKKMFCRKVRTDISDELLNRIDKYRDEEENH